MRYLSNLPINNQIEFEQKTKTKVSDKTGKFKHICIYLRTNK